MRTKIQLFAAIAASTGLAAAASAQNSSMASPLKKQGGKYGWSITGIPDVNGDGRGDYAVSAEAEPARGNPEAGRVYVYSGVNNQLLRIIIPPTKQMIGTFGWSVQGMPDVTGDGRGDLLIGGIWETSAQGKLCGRAYLYNGATGQMKFAWVNPAHQDNAGFGWDLAWVPDVNGDMRPDILISAPFEKVGPRTGAGRVYLFNGHTGKLLRVFFSPNYQQDGTYGFSVAGIPDINGDGRGDIIIGAPGENPGSSPKGAGRVYVYSGGNGKLIRAMRSGVETVDGAFGSAVSAVGDHNGDKRFDIIVGAPGEASNHGHPGGGRVYLFSGLNGVGLRRMSSPAPITQGRFGSDVDSIPGANHMPSNRMIIGAPGEHGGGRAYLFGPVGTPIPKYKSHYKGTGGNYGASVTGIPDTNGNGVGDVGIGAHGDYGYGRAYIYRR